MGTQSYLENLNALDQKTFKLLNARLAIANQNLNNDLKDLVNLSIQKEYFRRIKKRTFDCLVAEDDIEIMEIISGQLKLNGFKVEAVTNFKDLQTKLKENFYCTVFVDINMPKSLDVKEKELAWSYLKEFRVENTLTNIYIISAFAQEKHNLLGHPDLKIKANLQKPFSPRLLIPYLKSDLEDYKQLDQEIEGHQCFCLEKWKGIVGYHFCMERLKLVDGDISLASKLCNVSERTIRRAINASNDESIKEEGCRCLRE